MLHKGCGVNIFYILSTPSRYLCYEPAPGAGERGDSPCCHETVYCYGFERLNASYPIIVRHFTYVTLLQLTGDFNFPRLEHRLELPRSGQYSSPY